MKNQIAVVQTYIHLRTGKEVDISINSLRDFALLNKAYNIAVNWMNFNGVKMQLV